MADSGLSIGVLSGKLDLDAGSFKAEITLSAGALDELEKRFGGANNSAMSMAKGMFTAETAIEAVKAVAHLAADEIDNMTVRGAQIADVEENFNKLSLASGQLSGELLGNLKKGTHDTITDFELMKSVNDNLAAGVKLTSDQYNTLATGAFSLAQAKGISVKQAFDDINFALETGKVKTVQYLTGKIDLADAEDRYAKILGTSADRLSADEKQQAARLAVLDKVTQATQRLGDQQDGLDEKIDQAKVRWQNFDEELGSTVARSPIVIKAFDDVQKILNDAFGGNKEEMIRRITHGIEDLVTEGVEAVRVGVDIVKFMYEWREVLEPIAVGLVAIETGLVAISAAEKVQAMYSAFVALNPAVLAVAAAATLVYAAFELGKWQPVSDFFEKLGLEVMYGMSAAEAEAAVQTHHLTEAHTVATAAAKDHAAATLEIKLATQDYHKVLGSIDGTIIDWAEHLLQSGVSAKSVALEYGLTDSQVKALQQDIIATTKSTEDLNKTNTLMIDGVRLSRQEFKAWQESWIELNSLGSTYKDTLEGVNPKIKESVMYYAELGASVQELTKTFPGLTKEQATAAVESVKAAQEIQKANMDTFAIISKSHGDHISDWVKLETMKYDLSVRNLQLTGKATAEMLDAELAKFQATVEAETKKREEAITTSKAYYQAQVDDAQAKLDLMLSNASDFTAQDIRLATQDFNEKSRLLGHWAADANEKLSQQTDTTKKEVGAQKEAIVDLASSWDMVSGNIDKTTEHVKTLSGEIMTLKQYEAQQLMGGSTAYDLTTKEGIEQYRKLNPAASIQWSDDQIMAYAKKGGTLQGLIQTGVINPYSGMGGPPSFAEGGSGDFGSGTLAMLHGKEMVVPLDKTGGALGAVTNHFYVNGTAEESARKIADILMKQLKSTRKFGAA